MSAIRRTISILAAVASVIGILVGTLGTAVLLSVDLPGLGTLSQGARRGFAIATFIVLVITWVLFYLERKVLVEDLQAKLSRSRGLQQAIDGLSALRSEGVKSLFAVTPSAGDFDAWVQSFLGWERRVIDYMKANFTGAVVGLFSELGAIPGISFAHASNDPAIADKHMKCLRVLAKELAILERVIQQGSYLMRETNPTAWEIMRQNQQGG